MKFCKLKIPGPFIIKPKIFKDSRGVFFEKYRQKIVESHLSHKIKFVQENQSISKKNIFRGFHFQISPYAQSKLISVSQGRILDIIIDLRKNSKYFGKHIKIYLDSYYNNSLFVPKGFAHGFQTLQDNCELLYMHSEFYSSSCEGGIRFNDPDLNINWPLSLEFCSNRDKNHPRLNEIDPL